MILFVGFWRQVATVLRLLENGQYAAIVLTCVFLSVNLTGWAAGDHGISQKALWGRR